MSKSPHAGKQRDRRVSIRTPREDEGVAAAGAVAETPAERWRFSGGRDSEGAVRGTHVAPLGTLAFMVGRRVRISFAPAASQQRTRPPAISQPAGHRKARRPDNALGEAFRSGGTERCYGAGGEEMAPSSL